MPAPAPGLVPAVVPAPAVLAVPVPVPVVGVGVPAGVGVGLGDVDGLGLVLGLGVEDGLGAGLRPVWCDVVFEPWPPTRLPIVVPELCLPPTSASSGFPAMASNAVIPAIARRNMPTATTASGSGCRQRGWAACPPA